MTTTNKMKLPAELFLKVAKINKIVILIYLKIIYWTICSKMYNKKN